MLYVETSLLDENLIGPAVDNPVLADLLLRRRIAAVHRLLESSDDAFEAETRLTFIADRIRIHLRGVTDDPRTQIGDLPEKFRAFLDARLFEPVTLASASDRLRASPTHLARSFAGAFGIPPHTYLLGRRLEAARQRLLDGEPPAKVAVDVGFCDQSHFTRHIKRHLGTTPGRCVMSRDAESCQ